jgi:hypothetical protein
MALPHMALGVLLATFAAALAQSTPPPVSVEGVVVDKTTRAPLAGARVSVIAPRATAPDAPIVLGSSATTDSGGRFVLSVQGSALVSLTAGMAGYEPAQQRLPAAGQSGAFLEVALERLAEIRGRLVDDESRRPVAGVHLTAVRADGVQMAALVKGMTTGDDGNFEFKDLNRGDYYLRIEGTPGPVMQWIPAKELAGEGREKALQVPEPAEGYGIVRWPEDSGPAVHTASDTTEVGDIRLRRRKLHNLSGVLGGCDEGSLQVLLMGRNGNRMERLTDLDGACGGGFRILNLPEGTFTLIAQGGPPRRFVSQSIDGLTRSPIAVNVSTAVAVRIFIEVEGVLRADLPQDLQDVKIALTADNSSLKIDSPARLSGDEREALLFGNERYRLSVTPPITYYLKQIFYNGVASDDVTHFTAVPGAISTLRLVLSRNPGTVEVQAPRGATVFLVRDGSTFADFDIADRRTNTTLLLDEKARFTGLGPGKYRAFMALGSLPTMQTAFEAALRESKEVGVEAGQTVSVSLGGP